MPLFFLLCLTISWAIWIPQAVAKLTESQKVIAGGAPINMLAVWAPALSAIVLLRITEGRSALHGLVRSIRSGRVAMKWYLLVLLYPSATWLLARSLDLLFGRPFELIIPIITYFPAGQYFMVAAALVFAFPNTLGEEIGWRGFALPRLQSKYNALLSSILLGVFWAIWHIPLWIANDKLGLDLIRAVATITTYTILFTWVYNNTAGSVLLAWLFHASMTITQYILQIPLTLTDDIVGWGIALLLVMIAGSADLSRTQKRYALPTQPQAG